MENSVENETLEEFKLQIDRDSAVSKGEPTKKEIAISELKEIEKVIYYNSSKKNYHSLINPWNHDLIYLELNWRLKLIL